MAAIDPGLRRDDAGEAYVPRELVTTGLNHLNASKHHHAPPTLEHLFAAAEIAMSLSRFYHPGLCLALAAFLCQPAEGWAWGGEAHRIIALVADRLLQAQDPQVHKKISDTLATDKSNDWTKTDIASEATWADALREKSPEGRAATTKWHYVKFDPESADLRQACFGNPALPASTPASHGPQDNCVVDKIPQFANELRDPATSPGERLMALQFLLNLVGDIHDPLYTIERGDQSGRCTAVMPPGAKSPVRLSAYWDDTLVAEAEGKDPVRAAGQTAGGLTPSEIQQWSSGAPPQWAQESYNLAKTIVYNFPSDGDGKKFTFPAQKGEKDACGPVTVHRLDSAYRDRAAAAVKEQLAKAGVRLALLLRESLK
jgi:S1/P1 Nuclease